MLTRIGGMNGGLIRQYFIPLQQVADPITTHRAAVL